MLRIRALGRGGSYVVAMALVGLVACGGNNKASSGGAISLRAGLNDPSDVTIAVEMYLPQAITVTEGTTVTWTIAGPEPHSVTFFPPGQTPPAPGSDTSLFAPKPAVNGVYDGKSLTNSGLVPQGPQSAPPFKLRFDNAGKFTYYCVIHPQMVGTVTVVAKGTKADTQAAVTSRGNAEQRQWMQEGEDAKKTLTSTPTASTKNADGTTTRTVETGAATPHTDVLAFAPVNAAIKAGDRVTFVNNSGAPHTATFPGKQTPPTDPQSPQAQQPAKGPSPQTLNQTDLFNTGVLPPNMPPGQGPPLPARSFTFVVPTAGDYAYICVYHVPSGMSGVLKAT